MNHSKMTKTAHTLDTFVKIGGGFARAFCIVCVIFALLVLILGEKMYVPGSVSLDLDFVKLHLADEYQAVTPMLKTYTIVSLLAVGAICFTVHCAAKILRRILAPMKEGRPFEADVPANLRKIAWVALGGGAAVQLLGIADRLILSKAYPMEQIFASPAVTNVDFIFTMDFSFVLVFCLILFLSYIFSYGRALQQEADETL